MTYSHVENMIEYQAMRRRRLAAMREGTATDILGPQTDAPDPNDPETHQDPDAYRDRHDPER